MAPVRALALLVVAVLACGCGAETPGSEQPGVVTQPTGSGEPGELIEASPIDAPTGMRAWRITHHSRSATGRDTAVTGQLLTPEGPPPPGGFPLVAWGHPTTGAADVCAPSRQGPDQIHLASELTRRGWAIVATDYEGLGSDLPHPYLVGASEGHNVLDAARAAAEVPDAGVRADSPIALAGFSQGGHAALWAAELAPGYAPELVLLGVAVAAPVSDVPRFVARAEGSPDQFGVLVTVAHGFTSAYPELSLSDILTAEALERIDIVEEACIGRVVDVYTSPVEELRTRSPLDVPAWSRRLEENTAGQRTLGLPALVVQGEEDDIVPEAVTAELVARLCRDGDPVRYVTRPHTGHGVVTGEVLVPWLEDRRTGRPPPSDCPPTG